MNNVVKESVVDHVYVQDPTFICNVYSFEILAGNHKILIFNVLVTPEPAKIVTKCTWQTYSKQSLIAELAATNFNIGNDDVQSTWNNFEKILIPIVDKLPPLVPFPTTHQLNLQTLLLFKTLLLLSKIKSTCEKDC